MNKIIIIKTTALVLMLEGLAMIPSIVVALYYNENHTSAGLIFTSLVCVSLGITVFRVLNYYTLKLKTREGLLIAILSWFIVSLIGALPYWGSGEHFTFINSLFESVAGWTTTGAWVIPLSNMPKSLLMWKATTNWLGGVGILVFTISFFPALGIGGQNIAASEVTGPEITKLTARISDSAKISYIIYIVMTFIEMGLLMLDSRMGKFDAVINTLSTISTAGIFDNSGEIAWGFSAYAKTVITVFSLLGSINFSVYFLIYIGHIKDIFHNLEIRYYIAILGISSLLIGGSLIISQNYSILDGMGDALVQSISFGSTSGYSVSDITTWPTLAQAILFILMLIGGCSASTSGSLKVIRIVVFYKLIIRGIYKRIHPNAIKPIMLGKNPISASTASNVTVYIILYLAISAIGLLALSIDNQDMLTTISATFGALSNNGSGLGLISAGSYTMFSSFGKMVSAALMIIGRLELYAAIIIFSKAFWYPDSAR